MGAASGYDGEGEIHEVLCGKTKNARVCIFANCLVINLYLSHRSHQSRHASDGWLRTRQSSLHLSRLPFH